MDRVFQQNLDELDKSDLKKAVNQLETYVRYMKEQIEWAVQVLLKLDQGTSVADMANRLARMERSVGQLNQEYTQVSNAVLALSGDVSDINDEISDINDALSDKADTADVILKTDIVTTIDSTSTDDEIPTAKAVYDYIGGN